MNFGKQEESEIVRGHHLDTGVMTTRADTEPLSDMTSRLNSRDDLIREQAQEELRALISGDVRRIQRIQTLLLGEAAAFVFFVTPVTVLLSVSGLLMGIPGLHAFISSAVPASFGITLLLIVLQRRIARSIIALDIPQVVGPLIDVMATHSWCG